MIIGTTDDTAATDARHPAHAGFYENLANRSEENCDDIEAAISDLHSLSGVLDLLLDRLRGLRHLDCGDLCHTVQGCGDDLNYECDGLETLLRENREAEAFAHDQLQRC